MPVRKILEYVKYQPHSKRNQQLCPFFFGELKLADEKRVKNPLQHFSPLNKAGLA